MVSGRRTAPARGQRREALVTVAAEMFAQKPYDDIYISDIAEEAGVAHGLLFYHFKDKRGLYLAVLERVMTEDQRLHEPSEGEDTLEKRFRGLVRRHIEYRRDNPQTMLAMMRAAGQDPEVDALFERGRRSGAAFFLGLLGLEGEPQPALRVAVRGLIGMVDEAAVDWLTHDRDLPIDEFEELVYTAAVAVLNGVRHTHANVAAVVDELSRPSSA
jgi:AcrR family transcriptional regulator